MSDNYNYIYTNKLVNETSPYLLQHAHNPVNWVAWNNDVFKNADEKGKLIIISIGYSACHWCHVMEKETFMDTEIASLMNDNFTCIKVDREEHPDIDYLYMEAVQLISGNGGWPLNCFALPDGSPFWGGTYFRKEQWKDVLQQIIYLRDKHPEKLKEQANLLKNGIYDHSKIVVYNSESTVNKNMSKYLDTISYQLDNINGGTLNAPKFPMPVLYQLLLHSIFSENNKELKNHFILTLKKMAGSGIFDQLGGGFSRYATDNNWKIPHFKKMLYDNAQLISLYANAYRFFNNPLYKKVIDSTFTFLNSSLKDESGLYFSALDADSEGVEGKYYVWTKREIDNILTSNSDLFCEYYNISEAGNWENNQNILYTSENEEYLINKYNLDESRLKEVIENSKLVMLECRGKKVMPVLDDKIIVSWNSLMISALIDSYFAFGNRDYYQTALENIIYISDNYLTDDGKLSRIIDRNGKKINGLLDDYANYISALLSIYQADGDEKWILKSKELIDFCLKNFYDNKANLFYYNADYDNHLFTRSKELMDNVLPSSNSVIFHSIFLLAKILDDNDYLEIVKKGIHSMLALIDKYPSAYAHWIKLLMMVNNKFYIISIIGKDSQLIAGSIRKLYIPNTLVLNTDNESSLTHFENKFIEGKTMIYICSESECYIATDSINEVKAFIKEKVSQ